MKDLITQDYGWSGNLSTTAEYLAKPILKICQKYNGKKIIDLGCGNGSITKTLYDAGYDIVGCEPDLKGLEVAKKIMPKATFVSCSVYDDPIILADQKFDIAISTEVIEHLFYPGKLLSFAKSVLKPGGKLIVSTPYHGYMKNSLISICNKWDSHHDSLRDGGHIKFWSRKSLLNLMDGFEIQFVEFQGVGRLPFLWKSMILVGETHSAPIRS